MPLCESHQPSIQDTSIHLHGWLQISNGPVISRIKRVPLLEDRGDQAGVDGGRDNTVLEGKI